MLVLSLASKWIGHFGIIPDTAKLRLHFETGRGKTTRALCFGNRITADNNGDLCISGIDFIALSLKGGTLEQVRGTDTVTTLKRFASYSVQFTFICIALWTVWTICNTEHGAVEVYEAVHSCWTSLCFKGHGASFKVDCKSCFCYAGETICFPPQCPSLDNSGEARRAFTGVFICVSVPLQYFSPTIYFLLFSLSPSQVSHVAAPIILFQCVLVMDAHTPVPVWHAAWASKTINLFLAPAGARNPAHPTPARETRGERWTAPEQWWHISQFVITLGIIKKNGHSM